MSEEQKKYGEEKPKLSYSRTDEKPLLANQEAISAAVEHLTKHDAYYYQGLPEFEADQKFKDYYIQKYNREPEQKDVQGYVEGLIMECVEEDERQEEEKSATIKTSLGESFDKISKEENLKKDENNS